MRVALHDSQDVYKDAGLNVLFLQLKLNRENQPQEKSIIADIADKIQAIQRSMNIRCETANLRLAFGFSNEAWEYLFPTAAKPKELETFCEVKGPRHTAVATSADIFLHIRASNEAVIYEVSSQIMDVLRPISSVVDETHGFRYFEGRSIIGFIDGTENPVGEEAVDWGVIGEEDSFFAGGSYAFAQKYLHDMEAWKALSTEQQEKIIGRKKFSDIELDDEEKDPHAHNVIAQDNRDEQEHKIVRMNVPFSLPGHNQTGTYFIGYARYWSVTKQMLTNMFTQSDALLDYSTPVTGTLFFIPSRHLLDAIADGKL